MKLPYEVTPNILELITSISELIGEVNAKDYMKVFKDISTATASKDLKKATELNLIAKEGKDNRTAALVSFFPCQIDKEGHFYFHLP